MSSATLHHSMPWSNDKFRLTCVENINIRQLWKLINLSNGNNNNRSDLHKREIKEKQCATSNGALSSYKSHISTSENMSLLKFLAINALDLSAPAAPVLLQRQQIQICIKPEGWVQLSGHPESIVPTAAGIVRKRVAGLNDSEVKAYQIIKEDPIAKKIIPKFLGILEVNGETFIELQDLLYGFKDANVMDIKMGCRTFLESEVTNTKLRPDLYNKMIAVDPTAPTVEEHEHRAITKLRYMLFREEMSSSHSKGFRIEALRQRGSDPVTDLKKIRTNEQILDTISKFLSNRAEVTAQLIRRLTHMRSLMEQSEFFRAHEIIGSSIFIVYDDSKVGAWLIDFAKSSKLPENIKVDHRSEWVPGNREEGFLKGMDELIKSLESVQHMQRSAL